MTFLGLHANKITRGAKDGQIDWDKLTAGWDATIGGEIAAIAEHVCDFDTRPDETSTAPPREVQPRAIDQALASVQPSAAPGPAAS